MSIDHDDAYLFNKTIEDSAKQITSSLGTIAKLLGDILKELKSQQQDRQVQSINIVKNIKNAKDV